MKAILETMYSVLDLSSNDLLFYSTELIERRFLCSESASIEGWSRGERLELLGFRDCSIYQMPRTGKP